MLDTRWLDSLPPRDYLAAQDIVLERLGFFVTDDNPVDEETLVALMLIDERSRANVAALTEQYVRAPVLAFETDERLWQSVHGHYLALAQAYQAFVDRYADDLAQCPFLADLPQLLLNLADCRRHMAKWRYLRYQPMAEGGWLKLHQLYHLAETQGCAATKVRRYRDGAKTTLMACYLEALMLDTLNRTTMLKSEIEMVAGWLSDWSGMMELATEYDERRHLFFVDLEEDRGGRRIRNFQPAASYRYWDTDALVHSAEQARQDLQQGRTPAGLRRANEAPPLECLKLVEHLLTEWSLAVYQRQRRADEREGVAKRAQVVNGVLSVCQHVKNVAYARNHGGHASDQSRFDAGVADDGFVSAGFGGEAWVIENESKYGFGAAVNADLNLWMYPGKLVALDYEMNRDITVVGVVRSIKQLPENRRYVGIEVLSHTPGYVRLRSLAEHAGPQDFLSTGVFMTAVLAEEGAQFFPALYLPRDEEQNMPPTLLVPAMEFMAGGLFEMRSDRYGYQVRFGHVVERQDDWVRVAVAVTKQQS